MRKPTTDKKQLQVKRERLRVLDSSELGQVPGGCIPKGPASGLLG